MSSSPAPSAPRRPARSRFAILFSHDGVLALTALFVTGMGVMITWGTWSAWALVPIGIGAQFMNEYNIHRHLFHLKPPQRQWLFDLLYLAHYGHHDFPQAERLFFVPVWFAVPVAAINFSVVWVIATVFGFQDAALYAAAIVLVGGVATFLGYEWFHMTAHLNVAKSLFERRVTELHAQHHFRDFSKWFHVSPGGEVIDRVMGTAIDRAALRQQGRIEFITTLGLRPDDPRLVAARARFADRIGLGADEIARAARMPG